MTNFHFDEHKSFAENCEAFLNAIKADDPEMAAILRDNWDALSTIVQEGGGTNSQTRRGLNAKVAIALDALVVKSTNPKGGA